MDEIAVYRSRIGLFASIAHKQSLKRKPIPQRQRIKPFKHKKIVPQKTKQSERKKRNRKQCRSFHNKVFVFLIFTSFFCFIYKSNICLETLNTNVKWYPEKTLEQSYNCSFTDHPHENGTSGHYRDIKTESYDTSPLFFPEANAWTCRGGTSEVTADSWLRQRTCYFLLGNKGMHCSNGNPRQDGAANDHGEVTLIKSTISLIQERCNESVGYIRVKDSDDVTYGTGFRVGDSFLMTAYHVLDSKIDDIKERIVHTLSIYSEEAFANLTSCLQLPIERENTEDFVTAVKRALDNYLDKSATNISLLLQRLKSVIDVESLKTEFTTTWKRDCSVDFINHETFLLDWQIVFGEKDYDIAVLRLLPTRDGQAFPRATLLDENYRQHGNIQIIRYIHGDTPKVIVDQDTSVFKDDIELQAAKEWAINWWITEFRDVEGDYFKQQYSKCCKSIDEETGRVILRASKSFIPGSSGSPIIYMFNSNSVPVVEMIYQGGYPGFYYEPQMNRKDQFQRLDQLTVDCKCFFERGMTMKKLANLLIIHGKADLKENLFSQPKCADITSTRSKKPSDVMLVNLEKWDEDDQICYETRGVKAVVERIVDDENKYLAVIGVPGSGKSTAIRHAALYLHKRHNYIIYPILHPGDFDEYFDANCKQVFVMDDPIGEHSVDVNRLSEWDKHSERIKNSLEKSKNTKFLSSMRTQIFNDDSLAMTTYVFNDKSHCIDLCSEQYLLDYDEGCSMLNHYLKGSKLDDFLLFENFMDFADCFPLLCKVYSGEITVRSNLNEFFSNPFQALTNIFQNMKLKNKRQFCGLVLCSVFGNNLHRDILSPWCESNSESDIQLRDDVITSLCLDPKKDLEAIDSALKALDGIYVMRIGNEYTFSHETFQDIVNYLQSDPYFIYKFGSSKLILDRVRIDHALPDDDKYVLIFSGNENMKRLVHRLVADFLKESESGAVCIVLNCHIDDERFVSYLKEELLGIEDKAVKKEKINILYKWCIKVIDFKIHKYEEDSAGEITGPRLNLLIMLLEWGVKYNRQIEMQNNPYAVHVVGKTGSAKLLRLLHRNGHNMNAKDNDGNSLLHYVIRYAKGSCIVQLIEQCIANGCLVNVLNDVQESLMHYVVQYRKSELRVRLAETLIKHGYSFNNSNKYNKHIIHCIIDNVQGDFDVQLTKLLLRKLCLFDSAKSEMSVLQYIAKKCDNDNLLNISKLLINHGCSVNVTHRFGRSILDFLKENNSEVSVQLAELFINHGCSPTTTDVNGSNVLHHLCRSPIANKDVLLAEVYIKYGCPVDTIDYHGYNLLQKICQTPIGKNSVKLAKLFIKRRCPVKFKNKCIHLIKEVFQKNISGKLFCSKEGNVKLATLCIMQIMPYSERKECISLQRYANKDSIIKLAEVFIEHGCVDNDKNCDDQPLLHLLCADEIGKHIAELAELFINLGCRTNIIYYDGYNLLHVVRKHEFTEAKILAEVLIKHGCPVDIIDHGGCTLLHHVCMDFISESAVKWAEFFIKHGCPANVQNSNGNTALHELIDGINHTNEIDMNCVIMLVEMLIEHGCPVDNKNRNGRTLLRCLLSRKIDKYIIKLAEMFINDGCPVDNKDQYGYTLLHHLRDTWYINEYTIKLAELFIKHGCPVNSIDHEGQTVLHYYRPNIASANFYIKLMSLFIEKGCPVSGKDKDCRTILHHISGTDYMEYVKLAEVIIHHGCPVDIVDNEGCSVLHFIIKKHTLNTDDVKVIELCIKHGCPVNVRDERGQTLFHYIARYRNDKYGMQLAELFLAHGCPVNTVDDDGCTPLHKVLKSTCIDLAKFFMKHGCSARLPDKNGNPGLHHVLKGCCSSFCNEDVVSLIKLFIENGYPPGYVDKNNRTILHHIFIRLVWNIECIPKTFMERWYTKRINGTPSFDFITQLTELFIEHKCPVNIIDKNGYTAIDYAFNYCFSTMGNEYQCFCHFAGLLIQEGLTNIFSKEFYVPFLRNLVYCNYKDCEQLIALIAAQQLPLNITDKMGYSVLHVITHHHNNENGALLAELFIKNGCSVHTFDNNGLSLLHHVIETSEKESSSDLAKVFIKHGCPVNVIDKNKRTLLHHLSKHCKYDICVQLADLFISNGCPVNVKDKNGCTALHRVIQYSCNTNGLLLAELFIKHGCSVTDINKKGQSPLHLVSVYGKSVVSVPLAEMLIRNSCSIHYEDSSFLLGSQWENDTELVNSSIEHDCPMDIRNSQGCTVLHSLVQHCNSENHIFLAKLFVEHGFSVKTIDNNGCTVLHCLAKTRNNKYHLHLAELFMKHGCSVNMKDNNGNDPIGLVVQYCHGQHDIRLAEKFIKHGHPVSITDKNDKSEALLHHVIKHCENKNHVKLAELFINYGCSINTLNNEGNTLLQHALKFCDNEYHFALVQMFLEQGCPFNVLHTKNKILPHLVVKMHDYENYVRLTELFLETKHGVKELDDEGNVLARILIERCNYGSYNTLARLFLRQLSHSCGVYCKNYTTFHLVIECYNDDRQVRLAEIFIHQEFLSGPKGNEGDTVMPLSNQSCENNPAKRFIEHCFVTSIKQKFRRKTLHHLVSNYKNEVDIRIAELIIQHGRSVNTLIERDYFIYSYILKRQNNVSLKLAEVFIKHRCTLHKKYDRSIHRLINECKNDVGVQIVKLLIKHGCFVNNEDRESDDLLHYLTYCRSNMALELSKLFIKHGCSLNTINHNGRSLLHHMWPDYPDDMRLKMAELFIQNGCLEHTVRKCYWFHGLNFTNINDYSRHFTELFVTHGCPVDTYDRKYKTVLHHLAEHCNNENCVYLAELFIKHGCPVDAIDSDGYNAYHYVRNGGNEHRERLKEMLVKYSRDITLNES